EPRRPCECTRRAPLGAGLLAWAPLDPLRAHPGRPQRAGQPAGYQGRPQCAGFGERAAQRADSARLARALGSVGDIECDDTLRGYLAPTADGWRRPLAPGTHRFPPRPAMADGGSGRAAHLAPAALPRGPAEGPPLYRGYPARIRWTAGRLDAGA